MDFRNAVDKHMLFASLFLEPIQIILGIPPEKLLVGRPKHPLNEWLLAASSPVLFHLRHEACVLTSHPSQKIKNNYIIDS